MIKGTFSELQVVTEKVLSEENCAAIVGKRTSENN